MTRNMRNVICSGKTEVILGTPSEFEIIIKPRKPMTARRLLSNAAQEAMFFIESEGVFNPMDAFLLSRRRLLKEPRPDWDLSTEDIGLPIDFGFIRADQEIKFKGEFTGWIPPGFVGYSPFIFSLTILGEAET
jgi:hypothetical protein